MDNPSNNRATAQPPLQTHSMLGKAAVTAAFRRPTAATALQPVDLAAPPWPGARTKHWRSLLVHALSPAPGAGPAIIGAAASAPVCWQSWPRIGFLNSIEALELPVP